MSKPSKSKRSREPLKWYQVWGLALRPMVDNFEAILSRSEATRRRAFLWSAISGVISYLILTPVFIPRISEQMTAFSQTEVAIFFAICTPLMAAVLLSLIVLFYAGSGHFGARALGGTGDFTELLYCMSAFHSPFFLITSLISLNTLIFGGWISFVIAFIIGMYQLLACAMILIAVHNLPLQKAFAACIPIVLLISVSLAGNAQVLLTN